MVCDNLSLGLSNMTGYMYCVDSGLCNAIEMTENRKCEDYETNKKNESAIILTTETFFTNKNTYSRWRHLHAEVDCP